MGLGPGFNWVLLLVAVIVALSAVVVAVYLLIAYQHPEDHNQAWVPKLVVVLGTSLAIWTILLFPLDIANRKACALDVPLWQCSLAIPSKALWYACYFTNVGLTFVVIPLTMFYYEADSDLTLMQRWVSALMYELVVIAVMAVIVGVAYGVGGFVTFEVRGLYSGLARLSAIGNSAVNGTTLQASCPYPHSKGTANCLDACILTDTGPSDPIFAGTLCDSQQANTLVTTWRVRTSFPTYIMALDATAGWLLFMVFAGVGFVALPMDLIRAFMGRPLSSINRSEYIRRARDLGKRAADIKDVATKLKKEEREMGKGRAFRKNFRMLQNQIMVLEEDQHALELVFPQGEDPEASWAATVMGFYLQLIGGIVAIVLTATWLVHVVVYLFVSPPWYPFLNGFFIILDKAFPLFGTSAFTIYCFYLIVASIKGCMKMGLNFLVFTVHPMKLGATLMSSFLFNVALVLLSTTAAIQFCSQAFALYAADSTISDIFGNQMLHLDGLKYLYSTHVFVYCMFAFVGMSAVYFSIRGPDPWKRRKAEDAYNS